MNPLSFTSLSTTEDQENFIEKLKKVFEVMHIVDTESIELASYELKGIVRNWLDQRKKGTYEDVPPASWACFEEAFFRNFFPKNTEWPRYVNSSPLRNLAYCE